MGEKLRLYSILVGKPEKKRPLERPRHRSDDNIRIKNQVFVIKTGFIWPRIESCDKRLLLWRWTYEFCKSRV